MSNTGWTPVDESAASAGWTPVPETPPAKRTWLDSATDFGKEFWNQVNPIQGIKGTAQLAAHPIKTYTADAENRQQILDKAEDSFKKGNYAEGVAHALYGILPFVGPQLERSGEQFQSGEVAKGLGSTAGLAANIAAPELIKKVNIGLPGGAPKLAERMYQSALKPSTAADAGKVASAVHTGLQEGIPVTSGGLAKLGDLIDDTNTKISAEIANRPNVPINKFDVTSRLGGTAQSFATQVNPEADLNAVSQSGNEFLRNQPNEIPSAQAQAIKQGTYTQLSSKAYGELGSATVESQKALARGIKEELANAFPELSKLNAADSKFINLDDFLERAVKRIGNHQMFGIGTPLAAAGAKAVTGSTGAAAVVGTLKAIIDDPWVKSRVAIGLTRASKGGITLPVANARVAAYSNALGNAATPATPSDQGTQ